MKEWENSKKIRTCKELLLDFRRKGTVCNSSKIKFIGQARGEDVYNITAPFCFEGTRYIAGRTEKREEEFSHIVFYREEGDAWVKDAGLPALPLQDPFVSTVGKELVVGGVEVFPDAARPGELNYRTVFYRGDGLRSLKRFATGPDRMKDIRLLALRDGGILTMTRPQGRVSRRDGSTIEAGRGKIGFLLLDHLEELNAERLLEADVFTDQFIPEEWGGCNQLFALSDGTVGVLSHIARFDEAGNRHYYATAFRLEPHTGCHTPMRMIAERASFPAGPAKRPDLEDVVFSGGLLRRGDGLAELYCGTGDAEGQMAVIDDPFRE